MRGNALAEERQEVAHAIRGHPDTEPWMWEESPNAGPYCSLEVCRGHAATSDMLILVVSDELTEATELEWGAAQSSGATCAVLIKDGVEQDGHLRAFVATEKITSITRRFTSLSELRSEVNDFIRQNHTDSARRRLLSRRTAATSFASPGGPIAQAAFERAHANLWQGLTTEALEILDDLDSFFGDATPRPHELDILSGLIHGRLGDSQRARDAYQRIVDSEHSDPVSVAYAFQNLGLEALKAGEVDQSKSLMKEAYDRHKVNRDLFGLLQVTLNFGTIFLTDGDAGTAETMTDAAEYLIDEATEPLPTQEGGVAALRAQLAATRGEFEEARRLYRKVLRLSAAEMDSDGQIVAMQNIGATYLDEGRMGLAKRWYGRGLEAAQQSRDRWRERQIQQSLALVAHRQGDAKSALEAFEAARSLAVATGADTFAATYTADIGALLIGLDDQRAEFELHKARTALEAIDDRPWLFRVRSNLAVLARQTDDLEQALTHALHAIELAEDEADLLADGHLLAADLLIEIDPPDFAAQVEHHCYAAAGALELEGRRLARHLVECAWRIAQGGHGETALELMNGAVAHVNQADDFETYFDVKNDRSLVRIDYGDIETAAEELTALSAEARDHGNRSLEQRALLNLGETQRRLDLADEAVRSLSAAVDLAQHLGDAGAHADAANLLASAKLQSGDPEAARELANDVLGSAASRSDREVRSHALGVLAGVAFYHGEHEQAARLYARAATLTNPGQIQRLEDLAGASRSWAMIGDWPRCRRMLDRLANDAVTTGQQAEAWPMLLNAASAFLERDEITRAAKVFGLSIALALRADTRPDGTVNLDDSQFFRALFSTRLQIEYSEADAGSVWASIIRFGTDSEDEREALGDVVAQVTAHDIGTGS